MRFLHGALVILVLLLSSLCRSFGKCVNTLCFPDSTFRRGFWDTRLPGPTASGIEASLFTTFSVTVHSGRSCIESPRPKLFDIYQPKSLHQVSSSRSLILFDIFLVFA